LSSRPHKLRISPECEHEEANETIWHELAHARQVEGIGCYEDFESRWLCEMAEVGITPQDLLDDNFSIDDYLSTALEAEAIAVEAKFKNLLQIAL
jgi:hypothetical protein